MINEFNTNLNNLKTNLNETWTGPAASILNMSFSEAISAIDEIYASLNNFNNALEKLELYKKNKKEIANLEQLISQETENQNLINGWQAQIKRLTDENIQLKNEIIALLNTINPTDITTSAIITDNIQPKNNSDISHRGYTPGNIIDNSAEGFILAGENGFWGCEADVRFDSNGKLVCSHNAVKNGQNPTSFEEYLDICKKYGMNAIIDLKYEKGVGPADPYLSPTILKTIEEKGMMDSCILQTNNPVDIPYIRQTSKDARIWYLTDEITDKKLTLIEENNVECVNILSSENNAYRINKLTENGIDVCVWNVQTESTKERVLNLGAKYVMSDNVLGITPYQEGQEDFNEIVN